jgi:hypothetical protein
MKETKELHNLLTAYIQENKTKSEKLVRELEKLRR